MSSLYMYTYRMAYTSIAWNPHMHMSIDMSDHEHMVRVNQKRFPINYKMINKHGLGPYGDESYTIYVYTT